MAERLFGIETEYALTVLDANGKRLDLNRALARILHILQRDYLCVSDGSGRGVFLANGSRFYIDHPDHPEATTPECSNPWDAVRYQQAGDKILDELCLGLTRSDAQIAEVYVSRCNQDYGNSAHNTWGSHESYMHRGDPTKLPAQIIPHLVSRIVYTGAGGFNSHLDHGIHFAVSPRVWHLEHEISPHSTYARGIFHTKNETHASAGYNRLHILCGESLGSELASWLRVGTTALIVALIEADIAVGDAVRLDAPLAAMRAFAADVACTTTVPVAGARSLRAIDIQRHYLELVQRHLDHPVMPAWAEAVCVRWRDVLDRLEQDPSSLCAELDWCLKLAVFRRRAERAGVDWAKLRQWNHVAAKLPKETTDRPAPFLRRHGLDWSEIQRVTMLRDELFEMDSRFLGIGARGIFNAMDASGVLKHHVAGVDEVAHACQHPPTGSRAYARGQLVRELGGSPQSYVCDWRGLWDLNNRRAVDLSDPFAQSRVWGEWLPQDPALEALRARLGRSNELG